MSNHDVVQADLRARLARLVQRVGRIEGDLRRSHDDDWAEQALELENDEVLAGLDEMSLAEVRQIREALGRIRQGTYGVCTECGRSISAARLAALPSALMCIDCSS